MEINGVAHIFVTAGDFERSKAFYMQLLPFLGLKEVMNAAGVYYCVGGRTGFAVRAPSPEHAGERFVQNRVGLHHVCFRVRERDEVDACHDFLVSIGAHDRPPAAGRRLRARLLLGAVRGPGRRAAGGQPRARPGPADPRRLRPRRAAAERMTRAREGSGASA